MPLHDGVFEQPMWHTFLARLRQVAGVSYAGIVLHSAHAADPVRLTSASGEWSPVLHSLFSDRAEESDARRMKMREGRVYSLEELVEGAGTGAPNLRAMRLGSGSGLDAAVVVASEDEIGADVANLLTALAPHLTVALRVIAAMERERARSELSAEAFARMNFGWISLDAKCRIVDCDAQAERLLQQSGALRRGHYDRLTPAAPAVDRQLTALVREFTANPRGRPRAINLSHDPWIDILVAPLRIEALAGGTDAVAVVYIRGDRSSSADRAEQLVDLFDLTPSEARLAWSMAQGLSIAEAAEEHGLTIETARNYSKKIYAKTGARGQVDLVRHVLTGVLALA
ncbi:helix-turn-helix transcriptional regulator [Erythrobacter alti]|uniref:helix-turn-helix transcriptional regulator n=1 Tax=Erythrobacter alti TaxID=1896145 RepID=UPI0030F4A5F1